jgi:hypothetical protein
MIYIKEIHDYSWHPVWYTLYEDGKPENPITSTLIKRKEEIRKWIKETRFKCKVDKKGYNYRFDSEKEFTMFLLKWS